MKGDDAAESSQAEDGSFEDLSPERERARTADQQDSESLQASNALTGWPSGISQEISIISQDFASPQHLSPMDKWLSDSNQEVLARLYVPTSTSDTPPARFTTLLKHVLELYRVALQTRMSPKHLDQRSTAPPETIRNGYYILADWMFPTDATDPRIAEAMFKYKDLSDDISHALYNIGFILTERIAYHKIPKTVLKDTQTLMRTTPPSTWRHTQHDVPFAEDSLEKIGSDLETWAQVMEGLGACIEV